AQVATLPGLDGRKMSKSYDNTIPLFAPREQLKKLILSIVTDSKAPGEPKGADGSNVFQLYQAFANTEETASMRAAFESGIAWGDAKQALFERIDTEIAPLRERYQSLVAQPQRIEQQLRDGAQRLRARYATATLSALRHAVGLRDLGDADAASNIAPSDEFKTVVPQIKQYRESDGRFYFKLVRGERLLLQSIGFDSPRDAGARIGRLKQEGRALLTHAAGEGVHLGGELVGKLAEDAAIEEVLGALALLVEADV
ncbi:MAG: tryptophan--tRNA ligase, partial [Luteimonas sp.]